MSISKYHQSQQKMEFRWMLAVIAISCSIGGLWFWKTMQVIPSSENVPSTLQQINKSKLLSNNAVNNALPDPIVDQIGAKNNGNNRDNNSLESSALNITLPKQSAIEEEVSRNSHTVPIQLQHFANEIGKLMEYAMKNESQAKTSFAVLENCATFDGVARSAQSLCLVNASRLAKKYPNLLTNEMKSLELRVSNLTLANSKKRLLE